jgi:hypothetical protein
MRWLSRTSVSVALGVLLLSSVPVVSAQKMHTPKSAPMPPPQHTMAPSQQSQPPSQQSQSRVVVVEPVRVFDPAFDYPYPYAYPPDYMSSNFGYIKLKTDRKDAKVYVDGGFADDIGKAKSFALRPGNHEIEVRDSDNRTLFHERVQVLVGKTTELRVG